MKASLVRQFGIYVAISLFACIGMNACSDDSSNSGKAEDKGCTEAKTKECTDAGKICKDGECVKGEEDLCTEAKKKECTDAGKICKDGECAPNEQDLCSQAKIAECAQTNRDCKNGECVPKADPCTQEKINECTNDEGKVCENGKCVPKAVLSVTPTNEIPLVVYNLSMNEQDAQTPASYQFCYKLDTAPASDVTLSFEKNGTSSEHVGIEPATLTLNAENYSAADNCITVTDLNDGTPDKTQLDDVIHITATTASSQNKFAGLTANSSVKLKDTYAYEIQVNKNHFELHEENTPDFNILVRLMASPSANVTVTHDFSSCDTNGIGIEYKGITKPNQTDPDINNIFAPDVTGVADEVLWSNFKSYNYRVLDNASINSSETCTITFTAQSNDENFNGKSVSVTIKVTEDDH